MTVSGLGFPISEWLEGLVLWGVAEGFWGDIL